MKGVKKVIKKYGPDLQGPVDYMDIIGFVNNKRK